MEIKLLRLVDGTEIITQIDYRKSLDGPSIMISPFQVIFTPQQSGIIPFVGLAEGHTMPLPAKQFIMIECEPTENLLNQYKKAINPSSIETVKKPGLIVPS